MSQYSKIQLLFVCMGNICRSPAAEGVMSQLITHHGLTQNIQCDSAGTIGYHAGEKADRRMIFHSERRGYTLTSRARQFDPSQDFEHFDFILTMDDQNYTDILALDVDRKYRHKIHRMTDYCSRLKVREVPDPYYGGDQGFEEVLDILEDACSGLLKAIRKDYGL